MCTPRDVCTTPDTYAHTRTPVDTSEHLWTQPETTARPGSTTSVQSCLVRPCRRPEAEGKGEGGLKGSKQRQCAFPVVLILEQRLACQALPSPLLSPATPCEALTSRYTSVDCKSCSARCTKHPPPHLRHTHTHTHTHTQHVLCCTGYRNMVKKKVNEKVGVCAGARLCFQLCSFCTCKYLLCAEYQTSRNTRVNSSDIMQLFKFCKGELFAVDAEQRGIWAMGYPTWDCIVLLWVFTRGLWADTLVRLGGLRPGGNGGAPTFPGIPTMRNAQICTKGSARNGNGGAMGNFQRRRGGPHVKGPAPLRQPSSEALPIRLACYSFPPLKSNPSPPPSPVSLPYPALAPSGPCVSSGWRPWPAPGLDPPTS